MTLTETLSYSFFQFSHMLEKGSEAKGDILKICIHYLHT